MIHALYLSPRLIVARTGLSLHGKTHLILQRFEYSLHSRVLAHLDALGSRLSKTGSDLLSLPQAEHAPTNSGDQSERLILSRLPRRDSAARSRLDDAPGRPVSPRILRNPCKACIP